MTQYNIDFFDLNLNNVHHDVVSGINIDEDYLSPSETTIEIAKTDNVSNHDLVYIKGLIEFLGIVTKVSTKDYSTEISFKPFISLFDQDVLIDTDTQGKTALETVIVNKITEYWISSSDSLQNIPTLQVSATSSTTNWGMNLKSDQEERHHCIVGFYSVIIAKALSKYGIAVNASLDFATKKIIVTVGKVNESTFYVDADLENVVIQTFSLKEPSSAINKLEVWNTDNFTQKTYYYLHPDGSYNTSNTDRITPVVLGVTSASPSDDKTFAQAASEAASSSLDGVEWTNLIELEMNATDKLVNPLDMRFGQTVSVVHDDTAYASILTGKKLSETIVLVFGTVRHDLTKILKSGG